MSRNMQNFITYLAGVNSGVTAVMAPDWLFIITMVMGAVWLKFIQKKENKHA